MTERKSSTLQSPKKSDDLKSWIISIYDTKVLSDDELSDCYESVRYHGFDRDLMLKKLSEKIPDKKLCIQLIISCALNGPNRASKTKLKNGKTPDEMGISASKQQKTENLSCQRISASTADLAAYYLKRLDVPKRLLSEECPAWLQFPGAGSIKMPQKIREQHMKFSSAFSTQIGGKFNETIYAQMMDNAYLDDNLKLF